MGILTQVPQVRLNYGQPTTIQVLISTKKVMSIVDAPGATSIIKYNKLDGSDPDIMQASSPASTMTTATNAGNEITQTISVSVIDPISGVTSTRTINPSLIHRVIVDRLNEARSYISMPDSINSKFGELHVADTLASILSAANA